MNSIATAVPSGIRSSADRNVTVTSPVVTPSANAARSPRQPSRRNRGRRSARKISAPADSRSQAMPAGPTSSNMCTDRAAPSWTDSIAVTAIDQAGTRSATPIPDQRRGPLPRVATDVAPAGRSVMIVLGADAGLDHRHREPGCVIRQVAIGMGDIARERHRVAGVEVVDLTLDLERDLALQQQQQLAGPSAVGLAAVLIARSEDPVPQLHDVGRLSAGGEQRPSPG